MIRLLYGLGVGVSFLLAPTNLLAEEKTYFLSQNHWEHLLDADIGEGHAFNDGCPIYEEEVLAQAASIMGSRLGEIGIKIDGITLSNAWEMQVSASEEHQANLAKLLDFYNQDLSVEVTVKAFALPREGLNEAGLKSPEKPTVATIATRQQYQALMDRVSGMDGSVEIRLPSVIARSGQQAKIELVRELIYPTEFDPPQHPDGSPIGNTEPGATDAETKPLEASSFPVTPAQPSAFETRNTGLTCNIHPRLQLDGSIKMKLTLENVLFEGYVNYGSPIFAPVKTGLFKRKVVPVNLTENRMEMPIFSVERYEGAIKVPYQTYFMISGLTHQAEVTVEEKKLFKKVSKTIRQSMPAVYILSAKLVRSDGNATEVDMAQLDLSDL